MARRFYSGLPSLTSASRRRQEHLGLTVGGAEKFSNNFAIGAQLKSGAARFVYRPGAASGTLSFGLTAFDAAGSSRASGQSTVTLEPGATVATRIELAAGGGVADMGSGNLADLANCVPESDAAFCARLGKSCDSFTGADNCNAMRTAACGTCSGGKVCVSNSCVAPACGTAFNPTGTPLAVLGPKGPQYALLGASASGQSILYLKASGGNGSCVGTGATLFIADDASGALDFTTPQDITALANLSLFAKIEESMTLTADGLTIIGTTSTNRALQSSTRSASGATDFGPASTAMFDTINAAVPAGGTLQWPVLSADGLAFYYAVVNATNAGDDGIWESLRTSKTVPFPAAHRMPAAVNAFTAISGMSTDRMTAFVTVSFGTQLMTRDSLMNAFAVPTPAPTPPSSAYRVVPIAGCAKLLGTCEPGGCPNEQVCVWTKQ